MANSQYAEVLQRMPERAALAEDLDALQGKTYLLSATETDYHEGMYFYHTTTLQSLKCILRDGFISGSAEEKKKHKATGSMHDGVVCFTTNPFRHLSSMPDLSLMIGNGVILSAYLRFPYKALATWNIMPTAYRVTLSEIQQLPPDQHQRLVSEEKLTALYGADASAYVYRDWIVENEWRIVTRRFPLPKETAIFVSSPQQMRALDNLTSFPVKLDPLIREFRSASNDPEIIMQVRRDKTRIEHAADNVLRGLRTEDREAEYLDAHDADSAFMKLIRRAERIITAKDRKAAKAWLAEVRQEKRISLWLNPTTEESPIPTSLTAASSKDAQPQ